MASIIVTMQYVSGTEKSDESNLSITPPCPGKILPKSFTSKFLFRTDAERSPIILKNEMNGHATKSTVIIDLSSGMNAK